MTGEIGPAPGAPCLILTLDDPLMAIQFFNFLKAAIRKIMPRCTYEDMRLTPDLFDDPKHTDRLRNDYLEICAKIVEVTCGPFLELTSSALSGNGAIPPVAPRS